MRLSNGTSDVSGSCPLEHPPYSGRYLKKTRPWSLQWRLLDVFHPLEQVP